MRGNRRGSRRALSLPARPARPHARYDVSTMNAAELVRSVRERHNLSQARLAYRAGSTQQAISRVERGMISPSVGFLERVVAACGEELVLDTREREVAFDESQLAEQAAMPVGDRLLLASNANRLAGAMTGAAARALAGRDG